MDSSQKTFILGLGAQKAGTTWLHKYLSSDHFANFGVAKEYHIWDALFLPEGANRKLSFKDIFRKRPNSILTRLPSHELAIRYLMLEKDGFYENYFSWLARGRTYITGDITPGYAGLQTEQIQRVYDRFEGKGFRVKAIFLMRDPVERCWSAIRHHYRTSKSDRSQIDHSGQLEHLCMVLRSPAYVSRSRYDRTVVNLEECFPPEDLYFGLYETMFEPAELQRLSKFVGIASDASKVNQRVNVSPKQGEISPDMVAKIKETYAEVYNFCNERFPRTLEVWR